MSNTYLRNPCPQSAVPFVNGAIIISKLLLSIRRGWWPLITIFSTAFQCLYLRLGFRNLFLKFLKIIFGIRSSWTQILWMREQDLTKSSLTVKGKGKNINLAQVDHLLWQKSVTQGWKRVASIQSSLLPRALFPRWDTRLQNVLFKGSNFCLFSILFAG